MIAFLLGSALAQTTASTNTTNLCSNPLISQLTNVTLFSAPIPDVLGTCNGLWQSQGMCCDLTTLLAWHEKDKTELNWSASLITTMLNTLRTNFIAITAPLQSKIELPFNESIFSKLESELSTCSKFMEDSRGAALCSVCSGSSSKYFINSKAAITQPQCSAMVAACGIFFLDAFAIAIKIKEIAKKVEALSARTSPLMINFVKTMVGLVNLPLLVAVSKSKLNQALMEYASTGKISAKDNFEDALCNSFYNLIKKSFIQEMYLVIKEVEAELGQLKAVVDIVFPKPKTSLLSFSLGKRLLQDGLEAAPTESADSLFNADTEVVHPHASQSSSNWTPDIVFLNGVEIHPMNLSLAFP